MQSSVGSTKVVGCQVLLQATQTGDLVREVRRWLIIREHRSKNRKSKVVKNTKNHFANQQVVVIECGLDQDVPIEY